MPAAIMPCSTTRTRTSSPPIPVRRHGDHGQSRLIALEDDMIREAQHYYDIATWKMYAQISHHRIVSTMKNPNVQTYRTVASKDPPNPKEGTRTTRILCHEEASEDEIRLGTEAEQEELLFDLELDQECCEGQYKPSQHHDGSVDGSCTSGDKENRGPPSSGGILGQHGDDLNLPSRRSTSIMTKPQASTDVLRLSDPPTKLPSQLGFDCIDSTRHRTRRTTLQQEGRGSQHSDVPPFDNSNYRGRRLGLCPSSNAPSSDINRY